VAVSDFPWKTAWITGASSGIGRELALRLANAGVKVAASARSTDRLQELATQHPNITAVPLDVSDRRGVLLSPAPTGEAIGDIDLAVLNAGVWHGSRAVDLDGGKAAQSMAVNYLGVVNCIEALLPHMRRRRSGHIAMTGSVAGYRGLPTSCHYGPTKAALMNLAETLAIELSPDNIDITIINPGFIDTPMTSVNEFSMPYMMSAEEAAGRILRELPKKPFEIAFPWQLVWQLKIAKRMPNRLFLRRMRRAFGYTRDRGS
jgi:short-subunit dehydrogenase